MTPEREEMIREAYERLVWKPGFPVMRIYAPQSLSDLRMDIPADHIVDRDILTFERKSAVFPDHRLLFIECEGVVVHEERIPVNAERLYHG